MTAHTTFSTIPFFWQFSFRLLENHCARRRFNVYAPNTMQICWIHEKKTNAWRFLICVFLLFFFSFFYILISLFSTLVLDISFGSFVVVVILHGIIFETFTFATVRIIVKYYECFTYLCICFSTSYFLFYLEWTNSTATPPPTAQHLSKHFCKISLFGFHRPIDVLKICLKIYVMDTICSHSWKCFLANTW